MECISLLLDADVIDNTIRVMHTLRHALQDIRRLEAGSLLAEALLRLSSESIRGALHKGELAITNDIISRKNALLTAAGIPIPEGHAVINAADYSYSW
jgi:hypothetical protein